ncbi:MAG: DUF1573 domain-containing protein [Bacteroidetes bacterium]|nr:MAG: DUF1573 domain-containing protein [Bacteroidota bacterium]
MNNSLSSILALFIFSIVLTQIAYADDKKGAQLKLKQDIADMGVLYTDELEPVKMDIEFTNEGNEPLIISFVRGCCGTRINEWTREPIMPGEKGKVEIEFRLAPRPHRISRTVTIMSNDPDGMKVFRIRGEVAEPGDSTFGEKILEGAPRVR